MEEDLWGGENLPLTPARLRDLADWLDIGDIMAVQLAKIRGGTDIQLGSRIQQHLRRWADEIIQTHSLDIELDTPSPPEAGPAQAEAELTHEALGAPEVSFF